MTSTKTRDLMNRYFMGVMDIEVKSGTIDNMKVIDAFRIYNDKFVKSADLALLIAFDENDERWKTNPHNIMKDVVYDPKNCEWKRTFLETTNGHTPSEKMIEKWKRGEYVLNLITEYVQILETILIDDENLVHTAIENWDEKIRNKKVNMKKNAIQKNSD